MIDIRTVGNDSKLIREFEQLPYRLYENDKCWVPPLREAEAGIFRSDKNPALAFCNVERWVAMDDGICIGRVAAIINRRWIEKIGEYVGRISRFEVENDASVARALLMAAERWLRSMGMTRVMGPLGFSNLDMQGLTLKGFDCVAAMGSSLTKDYYPHFFEEAGYSAVQDWNEYRINVPDEIPEKICRVANVATGKHSLKVVRFESRQDVRKTAAEIMCLFDNTFESLFGTYRLGKELHNYYIRRYLNDLNPKYVFAVREDHQSYGRLVGFLVAVPSISNALIKCRGKMFPFGWIRVLWDLSHSDVVETLLVGVDPRCLRQGVMGLMMRELLEQCKKDGVRHIETTAVLEGNSKASSLVKEFDFEQHKQKRCFQKNLC